MQQMCKRTPMPKRDFNKVAKLHHNSFLLRYLILRNISCIYDQKVHGKTTDEWHTDDIRVHTSEWHPNGIWMT